MHVRAYDLMTVDDWGLLYGAANAGFCSGLATGVVPTTDCFGETMSGARTTQIFPRLFSYSNFIQPIT